MRAYNAGWSREELDRAEAILGECSSVGEACERIGAALGRSSNRRTISDAFAKGRRGPLSSYIGQRSPEPSQVAPPRAPSTDGRFQRLIELVRRGPMPFADLCDRLDLSPRRARELVESATAAGLQVHLENDHIGVAQSGRDDRVQEISPVTPTVGAVQRFAVISDTHAGSKYVLRDQLKDFVRYAYDQGIRDILHPGDVLDGCYRHGIFELTHTGADDQCQDALETLPQLPGLRYHFITGNHDFTFQERSGFSIGQHIVNYFRDNGRDDVTFYGDRSAYLNVGGAVVHLWHPKVGTAYARSYSIQKKIESYSAIKPQILLIGHWHIFCYIYERGIHGVACPTFQGGGSAFGKSLAGPAPALGGLILEWQLTEHGTIRNFNIETRFYFEKEVPVRIHNPIDAEPVAPTLYRSAPVRHAGR